MSALSRFQAAGGPQAARGPSPPPGSHRGHARGPGGHAPKAGGARSTALRDAFVARQASRRIARAITITSLKSRWPPRNPSSQRSTTPSASGLVRRWFTRSGFRRPSANSTTGVPPGRTGHALEWGGGLPGWPFPNYRPPPSWGDARGGELRESFGPSASRVGLPADLRRNQEEVRR